MTGPAIGGGEPSDTAPRNTLRTPSHDSVTADAVAAAQGAAYEADRRIDTQRHTA
jgi:hypothetical protein